MGFSMTSFLTLLVLGLVLASPAIAITCQEAVIKIMPCQLYLIGQSNITPFCCGAAQSLNAQLVTRDDRKTVCECFKKVGPSTGVLVDRARQLPQLCGLSLSMPIDYSVDCSKI